MVMAGNDNTPASAVEDSLSTRLQWLRQRREALQEKLAQKNMELKNLCVEEAEITGILPPEIPLEPGESPPVFRKRVGTAFTYPQNLINKLKSNEVEESTLELERQVQIGIVEAALAIVNDPMESKAVRRKHRLVYQQSQHRLQELEARLNFLRQSRSKTHHLTQYQAATIGNAQPHLHTNVKHRTKKPRPPLDVNDLNTKATRGLLQEGGVNLSPLGPEDKCNPYTSHGYDDQSLVPNNVHIGAFGPTMADQRQSIKVIEHDHNDNQNVYILPDQYRSRTYSHGSGGSRTKNHYQEGDRNYRPIPNVYTEDERQMRYRHFQQQQESVQNYQPYTDYKHLDGEVQRRSGQEYYERDYRTLHYPHIPEFPAYHKNNSQTQPALRRDRDSSGNKNLRYVDSPSEPPIPSGYWMRYEDEIVWCVDDQPVSDRFGSLDRRKRNAIQHSGNIGTEIQPRYRTVSVGGSKNPSYIAPHQNVSVHLLPLSEQPSTNSKMLLRTQSLGSVEKWHSTQLHDLHDSKDTTDNVSKKGREKQWYETSLDSSTSPVSDINVIPSHKNIQYQSSLAACSKTSLASNGESVKNSYVPVMNHRRAEASVTDNNQHMQSLPTHYETSRKKILEIPAESKSPQDLNEEAIMLGSPQNCTIVQAGKYQPYREITKPFEMSDFYKYSTKYRKRNEMNGQSASSETQEDTQLMNCATQDSNLLGDTESLTTTHSGSSASSVQKRIYQPVQRMTCQPYLASLR